MTQFTQTSGTTEQYETPVERQETKSLYVVINNRETGTVKFKVKAKESTRFVEPEDNELDLTKTNVWRLPYFPVIEIEVDDTGNSGANLEINLYRY